MTQRDFYNEIINANISEEITAYATAAIEKLNLANEKHKAAREKKKEENIPLINAIKENLDKETPKTAKEIAEIVGISFQKVSSLLKGMVNEGVANVTEIKIKGRGKANAYTAAI